MIVTMVSVVDETTAGERRTAWCMEIFEERLTLRELIRRRVFQEVAEHNARQGNAGDGGEFRGLVLPSKAGRVDAQAQYERAVEAFDRNGFVVLVGDRQVEELDELVCLRQRTGLARRTPPAGPGQ